MHSQNPEKVTQWQTLHLERQFVLREPLKQVITVVLVPLFAIIDEEDHLREGAWLLQPSQYLLLVLHRFLLAELISFNANTV